VAGGGGAVAVHVMPRYVLHNLLEVPLQCKQAATAVERELAPGVRPRIIDMSYSDNCQPVPAIVSLTLTRMFQDTLDAFRIPCSSMAVEL